ncbi:MAG TPA: hypothetical protein VN654_16795 [Vicinamibacterales bacterium]|jgi:hypothetical protein|nr:hypothetical protein [Vicinamibacterales bacterium]
MARFRCLLCDVISDRKTNHLCARECRASAGLHVDFCNDCRAACLRDLESQMSDPGVRERRDDWRTP